MIPAFDIDTSPLPLIYSQFILWMVGEYTYKSSHLNWTER